MKPNPECENSWCRKHQEIYQEKKKNAPPEEKQEERKKEIVHEEDWGITVVASSGDDDSQKNSTGTTPEGTYRDQYTRPQVRYSALMINHYPQVDEKNTVAVEESVELDDLVSQFKSLSGK